MKTLIGTCTKHDKKEFEKTPTYQTMLTDTVGVDRENHILYNGRFTNGVVRKNNKENIGKHYNKVLDMAVAEEYDTVILMHDDVHVDDWSWSVKLSEAFVEYDVVGLAGSKKTEIKQPALWHLMSKQEDWSGAVAHNANDRQIFMTNFGPTPERCLVLDGLFLAIKVSSLTPEVRFDENLPAIAHHYDIDFCLTANKNKLKLTTWPIWVIHKSPGLENPGQDFIDSERYFLDKWKNT
mgnify:CR=1 FL=1